MTNTNAHAIERILGREFQSFAEAEEAFIMAACRRPTDEEIPLLVLRVRPSKDKQDRIFHIEENIKRLNERVSKLEANAAPVAAQEDAGTTITLTLADVEYLEKLARKPEDTTGDDRFTSQSWSTVVPGGRAYRAYRAITKHCPAQFDVVCAASERTWFGAWKLTSATVKFKDAADAQLFRTRFLEGRA